MRKLRRPACLSGLMSSSIRTLGSDVLFYGVLDVLQRSVGFLLIPLYTRVLPQDQYGELDFLVTCAAGLAVLTDLQFVAALTRLYHEHDGRGSAARLTGTALVSRVLFSLPLVGLLVLVIATRAEPPRAGVNAWMLAGITVPLALAYEVLLLQARLLRRRWLFAAGALANCALATAVSASAILQFDLGLEGVLVGTLAGTSLGIAALAWGLRSRIQLGIDRVLLVEMLRYSAPLIPGWWLAFGSAYIGRFFVYTQLGAAENAVLAVTLKLAGIVGLFVGAFQMAWQPLVVAQIGSGVGDVFYVRSMRLYVAVGTMAVFWLTAGLGTLLGVLAPDSYGGVAELFPVFAVATMVSGFSNSLQLGHQIAKRTAWISISAFVAFAVNLAVMIWLTPLLGLAAAGWAMLACFVVKGVVVYFTAQARHFIPYDVRAFLLFGVGAACLIYMGLISSNEIGYPMWSAIGVLLFGSVLAGFIAGRSELSGLCHWLSFRSREVPPMPESISRSLEGPMALTVPEAKIDSRKP